MSAHATVGKRASAGSRDFLAGGGEPGAKGRVGADAVALRTAGFTRSRDRVAAAAGEVADPRPLGHRKERQQQPHGPLTLEGAVRDSRQFPKDGRPDPESSLRNLPRKYRAPALRRVRRPLQPAASPGQLLGGFSHCDQC